MDGTGLDTREQYVYMASGVTAPGDIMDWYATLKEWFEHHEQDSKLILDDEWTVQDHPELKNGLLVEHPNIPFSIGIHIKGDVIQMIVYTSIDTHTIPVEDRVEIYRDLLIMNDESDFIKFTLIGRYDRIALRTDIDPQYLSKLEFNNILNHFILAGKWLISKINPPEDEQDKVRQMMIQTLKMGIQMELDKGTDEETIINQLTAAGVPEEVALELLQEVKSTPVKVEPVKRFDDPTSYIQ